MGETEGITDLGRVVEMIMCKTSVIKSLMEVRVSVVELEVKLKI